MYSIYIYICIYIYIYVYIYIYIYVNSALSPSATVFCFFYL